MVAVAQGIRGEHAGDVLVARSGDDVAVGKAPDEQRLLLLVELGIALKESGVLVLLHQGLEEALKGALAVHVAGGLQVVAAGHGDGLVFRLAGGLRRDGADVRLSFAGVGAKGRGPPCAAGPFLYGAQLLVGKAHQRKGALHHAHVDEIALVAQELLGVLGDEVDGGAPGVALFHVAGAVRPVRQAALLHGAARLAALLRLLAADIAHDHLRAQGLVADGVLAGLIADPLDHADAAAVALALDGAAVGEALNEEDLLLGARIAIVPAQGLVLGIELGRAALFQAGLEEDLEALDVLDLLGLDAHLAALDVDGVGGGPLGCAGEALGLLGGLLVLLAQFIYAHHLRCADKVHGVADDGLVVERVGLGVAAVLGQEHQRGAAVLGFPHLRVAELGQVLLGGLALGVVVALALAGRGDGLYRRGGVGQRPDEHALFLRRELLKLGDVLAAAGAQALVKLREAVHVLDLRRGDLLALSGVLVEVDDVLALVAALELGVDVAGSVGLFRLLDVLNAGLAIGLAQKADGAAEEFEIIERAALGDLAVGVADLAGEHGPGGLFVDVVRGAPHRLAVWLAPAVHAQALCGVLHDIGAHALVDVLALLALPGLCLLLVEHLAVGKECDEEGPFRLAVGHIGAGDVVAARVLHGLLEKLGKALLVVDFVGARHGACGPSAPGAGHGAFLADLPARIAPLPLRLCHLRLHFPRRLTVDPQKIGDPLLLLVVSADRGCRYLGQGFSLLSVGYSTSYSRSLDLMSRPPLFCASCFRARMTCRISISPPSAAAM